MKFSQQGLSPALSDVLADTENLEVRLDNLPLSEKKLVLFILSPVLSLALRGCCLVIAKQPAKEVLTLSCHVSQFQVPSATACAACTCGWLKYTCRHNLRCFIHTSPHLARFSARHLTSALTWCCGRRLGT